MSRKFLRYAAVVGGVFAIFVMLNWNALMEASLVWRSVPEASEPVHTPRTDDETLDAKREHIVGRTVVDDRGELELLSESYLLDRVYLSMRGPYTFHRDIQLGKPSQADKTFYVTGVETNVLDARTMELESNEYLCHSNLTLKGDTDLDVFRADFPPAIHQNSRRLITLIPGRLNLQLPEGFGISVRGDTKLDYLTMALNANQDSIDKVVRMKTRISYRTHDAADEITPVFIRALVMYQQFLETTEKEASPPVLLLGNDDHNDEKCAEESAGIFQGGAASRFCSLPKRGSGDLTHPGLQCCVMNASSGGIMKRFGEHNTIHWMVPPGRHQYSTDVTPQMELPFDSTVHYVTGHLHPFGTWLRLVDAETEKVVFEITAEHRQERLGVLEMSEIIDRDGTILKKDRRYKLECEYINATDEPIDVMGILYLYAADIAPPTAAIAEKP